MVFQRCCNCNIAFNSQQLYGIHRNDKREIAIVKRDSNFHPPVDMNNEGKLCFNCSQSITTKHTVNNK